MTPRMQNSVNRQLGIVSMNAYKPLALLCFIIEVLPPLNRYRTAALLPPSPAGPRCIRRHLPPSLHGRFVAPAHATVHVCTSDDTCAIEVHALSDSVYCRRRVACLAFHMRDPVTAS